MDGARRVCAAGRLKEHSIRPNSVIFSILMALQRRQRPAREHFHVFWQVGVDVENGNARLLGMEQVIEQFFLGRFRWRLNQLAEHPMDECAIVELRSPPLLLWADCSNCVLQDFSEVFLAEFDVLVGLQSVFQVVLED